MSVLVTDADRYGRSVGDIRVDGVWINLKMVADGWAWHYRRYSQSEELADAERDARRMRLGLWADKEPTPPWEFRSGKTESRR
jgi:endonuclease YncB( thermonuclease family)